MYELNKHKRSDAIKWAIVFVSILVIITVVLAILSSGFRNWDVKTWFGQKDETEQTDPEPDPEVTPENGEAFIGEATGNGVKFAQTRIATA